MFEHSRGLVPIDFFLPCYKYKGYVKFVVASLPALFGDLEWGAKVQQWCIQRGWTLLWSLGTIEAGFYFIFGVVFFALFKRC